MTGATAYDLCVEALAKATPGTREHARIERIIEEWAAHPAMKARIVPIGERFGVRRDMDGRLLATVSTLREAEREALDCGFRVIDVTACGFFFPVLP